MIESLCLWIGKGCLDNIWLSWTQACTIFRLMSHCQQILSLFWHHMYVFVFRLAFWLAQLLQTWNECSFKCSTIKWTHSTVRLLNLKPHTVVDDSTSSRNDAWSGLNLCDANHATYPVSPCVLLIQQQSTGNGVLSAHVLSDLNMCVYVCVDVQYVCVCLWY